MERINVLAIDLGASSGRCMLGAFDGKKIELSEIHRFANGPVQAAGTLYWDVLRILQEIKVGIAKVNVPLLSVGIDTWGVDFGILDRQGQLVGNPVNYRDKRTEGMPSKVYQILSERDLYKKTGIQPMQINTIFQVYSIIQQNPQMLTLLDKILFMPDLLNYFLTGVMSTEYSIASTSGMLEATTKAWNDDVLKKLGIQKSWFTDSIVDAGTVLGDLLPEICENSVYPLPKVIASASHDTASAVLATPLEDEDSVYISCGTWSLVGMERENPVINDYTYEKGITNERGVDGKVRMLKNVNGLWVLQECKRHWESEGIVFDYSAMVNAAEEVPGGVCFIDLNNPMFMAPGNMQQRIQDFCRSTGQHVPESKAEIIRCIIDSLACQYRRAVDELGEAAGGAVSRIHIVGGGSRNALLCRITADITQKEVIAGPVEASSLGNMLVQLKAMGKVEGIESMRRIVKSSSVIETYKPQASQQFSTMYKNFMAIAK